MYKDYSREQWIKYFNLPEDYTVDAVFAFGSNEQYAFDYMRSRIARRAEGMRWNTLTSQYFDQLIEGEYNGRRFWFTVAYGGALLSEYVHLGCMFGSKMNILFGNCGGLMHETRTYDLIIPTYSYGTESSAAIYQPDAGNTYYAHEKLSQELIRRFEPRHRIHHGKTMTCQAMFGEGNALVQSWIDEGYYAVEMEASTLFAVSNHFGVPAAAVVKVIDNLAKGETWMDNGYDDATFSHEEILIDMFETAIDMFVDESLPERIG